jgi:hypothetical protein
MMGFAKRSNHPTICSNDMASPMPGSYPGPGTTLGPGMVFAYRAAMHAAGKGS